ncbi:hypothetical protein BV22DRAFT_1031792 [Leucogyrophana mollusca]|uniref:Uncharacterized protein n=1 Tax=Leucogyrophana mollusca TaxID=85980 RepID=A0ACB8BNF7_9AGAM|nr:hypothetical protein BV22DRAFT_1031792 [Leucogyrophana mollusca]
MNRCVTFWSVRPATCPLLRRLPSYAFLTGGGLTLSAGAGRTILLIWNVPGRHVARPGVIQTVTPEHDTKPRTPMHTAAGKT